MKHLLRLVASKKAHHTQKLGCRAPSWGPESRGRRKAGCSRSLLGRQELVSLGACFSSRPSDAHFNSLQAALSFLPSPLPTGAQGPIVCSECLLVFGAGSGLGLCTGAASSRQVHLPPMKAHLGRQYTGWVLQDGDEPTMPEALLVFSLLPAFKQTQM